MSNIKSAEEAKKAILERIAAKLSTVNENIVWGAHINRHSNYGTHGSTGVNKKHSNHVGHVNRHTNCH
ncbi:MAG: hypothetical protein J6W70_07370 [Lentisphaeria bacterium]|nr:hypothetical protein [Lentisphaeria bacterium]